MLKKKKNLNQVPCINMDTILTIISFSYLIHQKRNLIKLQKCQQKGKRGQEDEALGETDLGCDQTRSEPSFCKIQQGSFHDAADMSRWIAKEVYKYKQCI